VSKIKHHFQTIDFLKKAGAKIIIISHIALKPELEHRHSLKIVADIVAREYRLNVVFANDCLGDDVETIIATSRNDDIILLENLRFHPGEEECDFKFAKKLAGLADFYINDAFSMSHRRHASMCLLPQLLPHAFGFSFENELNMLRYFFNEAKSPKMSIVGGSKLSTKVKLLKNLTRRVNKLALGGGIAGVFLAFQDKIPIRISNLDSYANEIAAIVESAEKNGCELVLPVDFSALIGQHCLSEAIMCVGGDNMHCLESAIFDIGPDSVDLFKRHLAASATVLWNGPLGLFEKAPFDFGTKSVAEEMARLSRERKLVSIVGGGETSFAMNKFGVADDLTHLSISGGAFLTYLEGGDLPGLAAMTNALPLQLHDPAF
jgi:phosphoglycerate kinase